MAVLVTILGSGFDGSGFHLPTAAAPRARADLLHGYRERLRTSLLANWSFYIAVNLYNNEDIMPQFVDQINMLTQFLGPSNVFFSAFENGSTDRTREYLSRLRAQLQVNGVRNHINMGEGDWRQFCDDIGESWVREECKAATCKSLRRCSVPVRIAVMAAIRNKALEPLLNVQPGSSVAEAAAARTAARDAFRSGSRTADKIERDAVPGEERRLSLAPPAAEFAEAAGAAGLGAGADAGVDAGRGDGHRERMLLQSGGAGVEADSPVAATLAGAAMPTCTARPRQQLVAAKAADVEARRPAFPGRPAPARLLLQNDSGDIDGRDSAAASVAAAIAGDRGLAGPAAADLTRDEVRGAAADWVEKGMLSGTGGAFDASATLPWAEKEGGPASSGGGGATGSNPFAAGGDFDFEFASGSPGPGGLWGISSRRAAAPHLGLHNPVMVIFLNDVILYAEDVLELLLTEDGHYDMACGMDFEILKVYDT